MTWRDEDVLRQVGLRWRNKTAPARLTVTWRYEDVLRQVGLRRGNKTAPTRLAARWRYEDVLRQVGPRWGNKTAPTGLALTWRDDGLAGWVGLRRDRTEPRSRHMAIDLPPGGCQPGPITSFSRRTWMTPSFPWAAVSTAGQLPGKRSSWSRYSLPVRRPDCCRPLPLSFTAGGVPRDPRPMLSGGARICRP